MNKAFVFIERALTALPVFLINLYRKYLSPLKKPSCRFSPTCSVYALGALKEWGLICGTALALWRLVRCNPFSKGGYDPVPERKFLKNIGNTKNSHDRK